VAPGHSQKAKKLGTWQLPSSNHVSGACPNDVNTLQTGLPKLREDPSMGGCPLREIKLALAFRVSAPSHEAPWHAQIATESPFKAFDNGAHFTCEN
jgi:hypothetical protein